MHFRSMHPFNTSPLVTCYRQTVTIKRHKKILNKMECQPAAHHCLYTGQAKKKANTITYMCGLFCNFCPI